MSSVRAMGPMGLSQKITPEQLKKSISARKILQERKIEPFDKEFRPYITCNGDDILVYPENSTGLETVCFPENTLALSKTLHNLLQDLEAGNKNVDLRNKGLAIPHSGTAIKQAYYILTEYAENKDEKTRESKIKDIVNNYAFSQLIEVANCIEDLDCPPDINQTIITTIEEKLHNDSSNAGSQAFQELNPYIKSIVIDRFTTWLKTLHIQKYAFERKKMVTSEYVIPRSADDIAYMGEAFKNARFLSDNTKIIAQKLNNIIIYNTHDKTHENIVSLTENKIITYTVTDNGKYIAYVEGAQPHLYKIYVKEIGSQITTLLHTYSSRVRTLAFNRQATQLAIGLDEEKTLANHHNIDLWNLNNLEDPQRRIFNSKSGAILSLSFSPDGRMLVSGAEGDKNNVKIWDTSNGNLIKEIDAQSKWVSLVLFNPQGGEIISVGRDYAVGKKSTTESTSFILWNIHDLSKITSQELVGLSTKYYIYDNPILTWSPDGKIVICGQIGSDGNNTCTISDMSNPNNIKYYQIPKFTDPFKSIALSKDGKKMVSSNIGRGRIAGLYVYLAYWDFFTDNEDNMFKDIINYVPNKMRLLYEFYSNKVVTNPVTVTDLSKEMQQLLSGLPNFPKKQTGWTSWFDWRYMLKAIKDRLY